RSDLFIGRCGRRRRRHDGPRRYGWAESSARTRAPPISRSRAFRANVRRPQTMARILHIEDDAGNRLLVRKLLTSSGHEILEAADGIEGVRMARAERPDLILVDLDIPGLDGYEVTLRLRGEASLRDVPIVAITA